MYDTGITSIVTLQYWYFQYCTVVQYWYFQYCEYYNTGNTSIVNITILVIPVSRPAASYYQNLEIDIRYINTNIYITNYPTIVPFLKRM